LEIVLKSRLFHVQDWREQKLMIRIKNTDAKKLQDEYEKLVSGLAQANDTREDEDMMASPGTYPVHIG
jgi:hypothetical protein